MPNLRSELYATVSLMESASSPSGGGTALDPAGKRSERDLRDELMIAVRKLALDLHPSDAGIRRLGLDADLDGAFGFDSSVPAYRFRLLGACCRDGASVEVITITVQ